MYQQWQIYVYTYAVQYESNTIDTRLITSDRVTPDFRKSRNVVQNMFPSISKRC